MKTLKIYFEDMWGYDQFQFNHHNNYFVSLLSKKYNVVIDPNPDILFFSVFGLNNRRYNCKKVFVCGENTGHHFRNPLSEPCDVSLSQLDEKDKNIYFPLWVLFVNWFHQKQPNKLPSNPTFLCDVNDIINSGIIKKIKFCAFINNNPIEDRLKIFDLLNEYKKVDSYGGLNNNVGGPIRGSEQEKINVLRDYKFTIAFENSYHSGYNTEKIIQPLSVNTVPLYKGGERVKEFFNMKKIIYANDFNSLEEMANYIIELDKDEQKFSNIINSVGVHNRFFDFMPTNILAKLCCLLGL
jgi:hypothetical protein